MKLRTVSLISSNISKRLTTFSPKTKKKKEKKKKRVGQLNKIRKNKTYN